MSERARTPEELAEAVRGACLEAARGAYEDAGLSGLCAEGRWELALEAIRGLDLEPLARRLHSTSAWDSCGR